MNYSTQNITLAGRRLIASALSDGRKIEYTRIAIGDGEAPLATEEMQQLENHLFDLPVAKVVASDTQPGVYTLSTSFVPTGTQGDFIMRELGVYARLAADDDAALPPVETQEEEETEPGETAPNDVLFAYLNSGDSADFIHQSSGAGLTQIDLHVPIVTGAAEVLIIRDPNAASTIQDLDDLKKQVEEDLKDFKEGSVKELSDNIKEASEELKKATDSLNDAKDGFVKKGGDTMTGNLSFSGGAKVIGELQGSASQWSGWTHYDSITALGLTETTCTIKNITDKMALKSRLIYVYNNSTANANLPEARGMLDIVKSTNVLINVMFTSLTGQAYVGAVYNGTWTGWRTTSSVAPGVGAEWWGSGNPPAGWLLCQGQSLSTTTYAALFAAIGYTYGGSGTSFKLPDTRGYFLRGWDNGAGRDSGRKLGTTQTSGVPNIKGAAGYMEAVTGGPYTGPFIKSETAAGSQTYGGGIWESVYLVEFDASAVSSVYQGLLKEARPINLVTRYIIKY